MTSPQASKPIIAAFDFDGTITTRDTLISFLFFAAEFWPAFRKLIKVSPSLAAYALKRLSRQQTKEVVLTQFFKGMPIAQVRDLGKSFAASVNLKRLIRPEAWERIAWHRRQNHRCILISASIDVYLEPWAKQAGFSDVICSRLEKTPEGIVSGHLDGLNCWGPEKTRRLEELLGPSHQYILYAYGDSRGDHDLLAIADYPYFGKIPSSKPANEAVT